MYNIYMDAFKNYILQNWILILILGAFVVILFITSFSTKKMMISLLILLLSILGLSIVVFIEFYLQPIAENSTARTILMAIRYSATPFVIALVIMVLVRHLKIFVFIPAFILLVIDFISIFTGIVFGLDKDYKLVRGPLGFLPYAICALYMIFLIYLLIKRSNKRAMEIVPIAFLAVALSSGIIFPFVFGSDFAQIFCTIIAASLFIYYVFTVLQLTKKDALTGLLNRQAYYTETARFHKDITAIVSLDMNGLKKINDTYGHSTGDEALITLALCFSRACRGKQSAYRMGGDEFVIVCRKNTEDEVKALVARIEKFVSDTNYTCSIGYSYHASGITKLEEILKESDEKMYANKVDFYKTHER